MLRGLRNLRKICVLLAMVEMVGFLTSQNAAFLLGLKDKDLETLVKLARNTL